jgi:hypothetical protein
MSSKTSRRRLKKTVGRSNPRPVSGQVAASGIWAHVICSVSTFNVAGSTTAPAYGGLNNDASGLSMTNFANVYLDPYVIGGRFRSLADQFLQYRVRSVTARFRPAVTASGVTYNTGAANTTPGYAVREFAFGIAKDPNYAPGSFEIAVETGAQVTTTSRPASFTLRNLPWLFCYLPGGATIADLRQCALGSAYLVFRENSTAATPIYGQLMLDLDVEFRYAANIAVAALQGPTVVDQMHAELDERKSRDLAQCVLDGFTDVGSASAVGDRGQVSSGIETTTRVFSNPIVAHRAAVIEARRKVLGT